MSPEEFGLHKAAYGVSELLEIMPFGRTALYAEVRAGRLKATKLGKKTLFLAPDIAAFLSALPASKSSPSNPIKRYASTVSSLREGKGDGAA